jgi:streptogramin lyase
VTFGPDVWEGGTQSVTNPLLADGYAITTDKYGNIWVTLRDSNKIGKIDPSCNTSTIALGTPPTGATTNGPSGIVALPDGSVWFTEYVSGKVGKIAQTDATHATLVGEYALPGSSSQPLGIARGYDGALWFTEYAASKIGRMDPSTQTVAEYALASGHHPKWIAATGRLMTFTEAGYGLGTITMKGVITENTRYPFNTSGGTGLTVSADGATVYTVDNTSSATPQVRKFQVSVDATSGAAEVGVITEPTPVAADTTTASGNPGQLAQDKLGRVWYTDAATSSIAVAGQSGTSAATGSSPVAIASSPSGNVIYMQAAGTVRVSGQTVAAQDVASAAVTASSPSAGGGCSTDPKGAFDPVFPGLLGAALMYLRRKYRKQQ